MGQRIKGQEVETIFLRDGAPIQNFGFIRSIEFTFKLEILQEGYIGETTDRYDSVFKGIAGSAEAHFDDPATFDAINGMVDKARRRQPGTRFNMKATLNFPSGRRARILIPDIEFGEIPVNFASRSDYGTVSIPYGASIAQVLPQ